MARPSSVTLRAAACLLVGSGFALWPLWFAPDTEVPSRWLLFAGGFHPLALHLPIGLVVALVAFEAWNVARRRDDASLRCFLWLVTALSASLSFVTGAVLGSAGGHEPEMLTPHLWFAGVFTALCWASLGILLLKDTRPARFATLACVALAMAATGHFGGVMVHGSPLAHAPWRPDPTAIEFLPPLGENIDVYGDLVHPILTAKCQGCHGPGKQNGRLRLDSFERLLAGGAHGPALVPGRAPQSRLLQAILLPLDNEKHMPPKNRPQLNQAEIDLLHWWIETGAAPQVNLVATEAPEVVRPFLVPGYRLLPDRELLARQAKEEQARREAQARRREDLAAKLAQVSPKHRPWFAFTGESTADLDFAVTTSPEAFGDEQLASLAPILRECHRITLAGTQVTDEGLAGLRVTAAVRELNLRQTRVTNRGMLALAGASQLETLNLYGTAVDDGLAAQPPPLPALRRFYLGDTRVGAEALARLRSHYPGAEIVGSLSMPVAVVLPAKPAAAASTNP